MGFRVNSNITAMQAISNSQTNAIRQNRNLESLSTGLRINRAADDSSGLAIANKLSAQSRGLSQAIKNANDGIGLLQTADGAMEEMTNIAKRIRVLALQGANDSQDVTSRSHLVKELQALNGEFSDIVNQTKFNGIKLLDGSHGATPFIGAGASGNTTLGGIQDFNNSTATANTFFGGFLDSTNSSISNFNMSGGFLNITGSTIEGGSMSGGSVTITNGVLISGTFNGSIGVATGVAGGEFKFHVGAYADDVQSVTIGDASMSQLHSDAGGDGTINISPTTIADFEDLVEDMSYVLKGIDSKRATLGASQNKLESTIRNISVTQVNVESARSNIENVDFADESASFAKHNIIAQSGSYVMSQANAKYSNIMSLFI